MITLNDVISDYDINISRLELGREITMPRKKQDKIDITFRKECKEKLTSGIYTPWEFLASIPAFFKVFSDSAPLSTIYSRYRPPPESLNILLHLYLFNDNKEYLLV